MTNIRTIHPTAPDRPVWVSFILILLLVALVLPVQANTLTTNLQVRAASACPSGCSCMPPGQAANMQYVRCSENANPCSYDSVKQPLYCYKPQTCPSGCECLSDADAKTRYGSYTRCSETPCLVNTATTAVIPPKYCVKPAPVVTLPVRTLTLVPSPVCPGGCECLSGSEAASRFGTYERCSETACGQDYSSPTHVGSKYCYRQATPGTCPEGCDCITPDDAKLKFGFLPDRCSSDVCGYYTPVTTAANPVAKYCFKRPAATPGVTPAPVCPQNCACLMPDEAKKLGYPPCGGIENVCGYSETKQAYYCYEKVPEPSCIYDYRKNACTGTCGQQGYSCGLVYSKKDESGKVTEAVCDCIPPATPGCSYDAAKNACSGTCPNGAACARLGLSQSAAAAPVPLCGCEAASCFFDYAKDSCVGSCSDPAAACQLNTMYRDQATGKTTYAECHCKGKEEISGITGIRPGPLSVATTSGIPCGCSAAANTCTGDCPAGQTCFLMTTTTDAAGKNLCGTCECKAVCQLDATGSACTGYCPEGTGCQIFRDRDASGAEKIGCGCTNTVRAPAATPVRAPDVFTSIGNFFKSLFGMK